MSFDGAVTIPPNSSRSLRVFAVSSRSSALMESSSLYGIDNNCRAICTAFVQIRPVAGPDAHWRAGLVPSFLLMRR